MTQLNPFYTNKWQLTGATYLVDQQFHFVGDHFQDKILLSFDVNHTSRLIEIPRTLKSLNNISDAIRDGIAYYAVNAFDVNHYTHFFINTSWQQTSETAICYCYLPYDALDNTLILCDKYQTVSEQITASDHCGIKVIKNVLAIRLPKEMLGLSVNASNEEIIRQFARHFQHYSFCVIYRLKRIEAISLSDSIFFLNDKDNVITPTTHFAPSSFEIDYPIDVIVNSVASINIHQLNNLSNTISQLEEEMPKAIKSAIEVHNSHTDSHEDIREQIALLACNDFGAY